MIAQAESGAFRKHPHCYTRIIQCPCKKSMSVQSPHFPSTQPGMRTNSGATSPTQASMAMRPCFSSASRKEIKAVKPFIANPGTKGNGKQWRIPGCCLVTVTAPFGMKFAWVAWWHAKLKHWASGLTEPGQELLALRSQAQRIKVEVLAAQLEKLPTPLFCAADKQTGLR